MMPESELSAMRSAVLDGFTTPLDHVDESKDDTSHPFWNAYYRVNHHASSDSTSGIETLARAVAAIQIQSWWRGERTRQLARMVEGVSRRHRSTNREVPPQRGTAANGDSRKRRMSTVEQFHMRRQVRSIADRIKKFHMELL
jgi:hypothetical protein